MKKFLAFILILIILGGGVFMGSRLIHKCDDCGKTFVGTGYEANFVTNVLLDQDDTICKECAEVHHIIETSLGKSLDDYKKGLFE